MSVNWLKSREPGVARRAFLGTAGTIIGLPFLESLIPRQARAQAPAQPKRLIYYYVPCGIHMPAWTPTTTGPGYALTPILQPLAALKSDFMVVSGLENAPAKPDGAGDHAAGTASFITCAHAFKSDTVFKLGISADQVAANANGKNTRIPSVQLGVDGGALAGGCDSGYGCPYARAISWASETTPLPKVTNPATAFNLLFMGFTPGATQAEQVKRQLYKKSVLDVAVAEAQALSAKLGVTDRRKMSEYLTGVRELERQVGGAGSGVVCSPGTAPATPAEFDKLMQTYSDIMVLAMQCDVSRIFTFMLGNAGSGRTYPTVGATRGHHDISHHGDQKANLDLLQAISTYEIQQLAYLLNKMKTTADGAGNLLQNSTLYWSSEISDGNRHNHDNMPVLIAGHGGGMLNTGQHILYPAATKTKVANALVTTLRTAGLATATLGDSTGVLPELLKS